MHYRLRVTCWNEINNNPKVIINVNYFVCAKQGLNLRILR